MDSHDNRRYDSAGDAFRWLATGFGLGMLIGGALGILLAPKPGRETREQLKEIATDLGERARTVAGEFGEKTAATYSTVSEQTRTRSTELGGKVRSIAGDLTSKVSTAKETGTRAMKAVKEGYKKTVEELGSEEGAEEDIDVQVEVDVDTDEK